MSSPAKVLFIGIDAGDKDLILHWANQGLLPTFRSLLSKAAWGSTTNPVGLYVGAIWPSFATAVSPAKHGCYCYSQLEPGTYRTKQYSVFDLKGELFWDTLSRAGQRVAIIDAPRIPPSENLNGMQIVDWGTHDPDLPDTLYTWPRSLAAEVEERFGRDPIGYCNAIPRTVKGFQHFEEDLKTRAQKKTELSSHFLAQGGWDLFMTFFTESHCVGHQCWHLNDPSHPKHNPEIASAVGNPIQEVYIAIDKGIGQLLSEVDSETTVFVLASHGMGPHYDGTFLLDEILCQLEKVSTPPVRQQLAKALNSSWEKTPLLSYLLKPLRRHVWQPLRRYVWKSDKPLRHAIAEPDASRRNCFTIPNNDTYGAIRVNLVGREPNGKIKPGADYEAFCESLRQDLLEIVNVDTGKPLVRNLLKTADLYSGEEMEMLPDLLVEWNREDPIRAAYSPKIGTVEKPLQTVRTGDHKAEGMFFVLGPSISAGRIEQIPAIEDFAPTIAALLNVPLNAVDGKPILEILQMSQQPAEIAVQCQIK